MEGLPPTFSTGCFGPPQIMDRNTAIWSYNEENIFENALVEVDMFSPDVYEQIQTRLPGKSIDQIKRRMEEFIAQVAMTGEENTPTFDFEGNSSQQKAKRVRWTEEEHNMFLVGLEKYGKGSWDSISRFLVPSKTTSQVASHAQKYFRRLRNTTPPQKRRSSIHDIRVIGSNIVQISPRPNSQEEVKVYQGVSYPIHLPHDEPFIQITGQMYGNSSRLNPHLWTCNNSSLECNNEDLLTYNSSAVNEYNNAPITPTTTPMYPKMSGGPFETSHLVSSPLFACNNYATNAHATLSPITSPICNGSSQINSSTSAYNNSNPAITPTTTPMCPVDQDPPCYPTLINSPCFAYRDSILNDNASFIPFTSPMNPEHGISHLFNSYPNNL